MYQSDKKGYQFVGWKFMDREDAGCYQAGDRLESLYRVKDEGDPNVCCLETGTR